MKKGRLSEKFALFDQHWTPKILGAVGDYHVKVFKALGEFVWHKHDDQDEFFLIIQGTLIMRFRDHDVILEAGDYLIVPKGVEHMPVAEEEVHVLLLEPSEVVNTGDADSAKKAENLDWI